MMLLKVTYSDIYIYIYILNIQRERERESQVGKSRMKAKLESQVGKSSRKVKLESQLEQTLSVRLAALQQLFVVSTSCNIIVLQSAIF